MTYTASSTFLTPAGEALLAKKNEVEMYQLRTARNKAKAEYEASKRGGDSFGNFNAAGPAGGSAPTNNMGDGLRAPTREEIFQDAARANRMQRAEDDYQRNKTFSARQREFNQRLVAQEQAALRQKNREQADAGALWKARG